MAKRDISTRIILEGEKEYRNAMKSIQAEYKTLQSAMKLTDAEFKNQQNTFAALSAKQKNLTDVVQKLSEKLKLQQDALKRSTDLQAQFTQKAEAARKQIEEKQRKLEALRKTTGDTTKEEERLEKEIEELTKEYNLNATNAERCKQDTEKYKDEINKTEKELVEYSDALKKNSKYLDEASKSADGCATSIDETGKELKQTGEAGTNMGDSLVGAFRAVKAGIAAAGITMALRAMVGAIKECVTASIQFESAMAGVAKTNNLEGEALAAMSKQVLELSKTMPMSATEFASIMETAGQLGVANENLISFSKTMANLGVATNMTADEAATMLAQFTAITGMNAADYDKLGAAVVALGNNFATTEKRIVDMAQGVAGAGANAGLTEAQMLALSTAVSSVGIEAAAGGTNLSGLITKMQTAVETGDDLDKWARACGMSTYELAGLWKTDASQALLAFIQNVNDANVPLSVMLADLELSDKRMTRLVTSLAGAEDESQMLSRALGMANQAWRENNALTKEAETRYNTTQSKLSVMNNQIEATKIAFGDSWRESVGNASENIANFYSELEALAESDAWEKIGEKASGLFGGVTDKGSEWISIFRAMLTNMMGDTEGAAKQAYESIAKYNKEYFDSATGTMYTMANAADLDADAVARLSEQYAGFAETVASWAEQGIVSKDLIVETTEAVIEQTEEMAELDEEMLLQLNTQEAYFQDLINRYDEYYSQAKQTAESAFGLFEKVDVKWVKSSKKADREVKNLGKNLDTQAGFWDRYTENITTAMEEGIDKGLILKLSDGSVENAKYLDMIVNATGEAREQLVEKFKSVDEGTTAFAEAVALLKTDVDKDMNDVEKKVNEAVATLNQASKAKANASATAQGVIDGLNSKYDRAYQIVQNYKKLMRSMGSGSSDGSGHAAGLSYVPYDEYPALLHKGEMVLTRLEAEAYRAAERSVSNVTTTSNTYNNQTVNSGISKDLLREIAQMAGNTINIYPSEGMNINQLADKVSERMEQKQRQKASVYA